MNATNSTMPRVSPEAESRGILRRAIVRLRAVAWIAMLAADIGLLAWAAMAAAAPELLMGPRSMPILPAGFEGFTGGSWAALIATSPRTADYVALLFRMFGLYGVGFSLVAIGVAANSFRRHERWAWWALLVGNSITYVGAMAYDQIVRAVGPLELLEYVAIAVVYAALVVTAGSWKRSV